MPWQSQPDLPGATGSRERLAWTEALTLAMETGILPASAIGAAPWPQSARSVQAPKLEPHATRSHPGDAA